MVNNVSVSVENQFSLGLTVHVIGSPIGLLH